VLTGKTVEWHLGHIYRKLAIGSRRELAEALGSRRGTPGSAR
jgi:DNA-binding CsgD family transcriptional regulator